MAILNWKSETLASNGAWVVDPVAACNVPGLTSVVQDQATGSMYAVQPALHRVVKIDLSGTLSVVSTAFTTDIAWLYMANGVLFVSDQAGAGLGAGFLYKLTTAGVKTTIASGLTRPHAVIVTADGVTAYVECEADYWFGILGADLVEINVGTGTPIHHYQYPRGGFNAFLTTPQGLTFGPGSERYIYAYYDVRTQAIDEYDTLTDTWTTISMLARIYGSGMAVLPSDTNLYFMNRTVSAPSTAGSCNYGGVYASPNVEAINYGGPTFTLIAGSAYQQPVLCNAGIKDDANIPIPAPTNLLAYGDPGAVTWNFPTQLSPTAFGLPATGAILIADTTNGLVRRLQPIYAIIPPPDPPSPITTKVRRLGCGDYVIGYAMRGGVLKGLLPGVTSVSFDRKLNDVSTAKITMGGGAGGIGGFASSCCEAVNKITCIGGPWAVEIHIFRNLKLVWCGPLTDMLLEPGSGTITLEARDLFSLFDRRFWHGTGDRTLPYPYIRGIMAGGGDINPDLDATDTDIVNVFYAVVYDAMLPEPVSFSIKAGIHNAGTNVFDIYDFSAIPNGDSSYGYSSLLTGFTAERYASQTQYISSGQILREVSQDGIDFTMVNRVLYTGAEQISATDLPIGIFTDGSFKTAPTIHIIGLDQATRFVVGANGTGTDGPNDVGDSAHPAIPLTAGGTFPTALPPLPVDGGHGVTGQPGVDSVYGLLEEYDYIGDIKDTWNNGGSSKGPGAGTIHGIPQPYFPASIPPGVDPDGFSIWQAVIVRYQQFGLPYAIVEQAQLKDDAPFEMSDLIPGVHVGVRLSEACVPILENYRLRDVTVQASGDSESVAITLIPLGTVAYGQPSATTIFGYCP